MPRAVKPSKRAKRDMTDADIDSYMENQARKHSQLSQTQQPNDALFFVDTTGNVNSRRSLKRQQRDEQEQREKEEKEQQQRAFHKKQRLDSAKQKQFQDFRGRSIMPQKSLHGNDNNDNNNKKPAKRSANEPTFDLWATDAKTTFPVSKYKPYTGTDDRAKHLFSRDLTAKQLPHAGSSYNPCPEAHAELVRIAVQMHEEEYKNTRALDIKVGEARRDDEQNTRPNAMLEETSENAEKGAHGEEKEDRLSVNPPVEVKRLTRTERNKLNEKKIKQSLREAESAQKQLEKDLNRLPVILAEIRKKMKLRRKQKALVAKLKEANPPKPKLGKYELEEAFAAVPLTEEITGSLREVVPSLTTFDDQFKRFQLRQVIEPRKKHNLKPRYARKFYDRYKDSKEPQDFKRPMERFKDEVEKIQEHERLSKM